VGGAPALLSRTRTAALVALVAALALWEAFAGSLPDLPNRWDVALVACVLIPATFATVWLALPLAAARGLLPVGVAFAALAVALDVAGLDALFNVAKLAALALLGFWFLELFQALWWVVAVAVVIPWVDAISVWRGPTDYVVSEQPGLFDRISISFRIPGEDSSANLGPPDVLFFALFLATADRFGLRAGWTWIGMTGLLALTLVLTASFDVAGLPALPAVCVGFLLPNVDLLWRRARAAREEPADSAL
jgi:hypothetical protein